MASKQKTKFAILGLLSWKPMSGYDIKKIVDVGLSHFWQENYGQIYPTLEAIVREGLADRKKACSTGDRVRIEYVITRKGEQLFREWLAQPTAPPIVRNELQLKFFLSCHMPGKTSVLLIQEYRNQQQAVLSEYRESERILRNAVRKGEVPTEVESLLKMTNTRQTVKSRTRQCTIFLLTLRHGIRAIEARLAWCDEVTEILNPQG